MKTQGLKALVISLFLFLELLFCMSVRAGTPVIRTDQVISTGGYFRLTWQAGNPAPSVSEPSFLVQQSRSADFAVGTTLYRGAEQASLISGQPNGVYFYRVRETRQAHWSNPVRVEVRHHSLNTALQFFGLGLLVFGLTLFTILHGVRQTRS